MITNCQMCDRHVSKCGPLWRYKYIYYKGQHLGGKQLYVCKDCKEKGKTQQEYEYWKCDNCGKKFRMTKGKRPVLCLPCNHGYFTKITKEDYEEPEIVDGFYVDVL